MIYIGRGRFLDVDNILEMEENPALVYGDKIINGKTVYSLIKKIPGVLTTNGAIFGIVKKGKVIRLVSTESRYPRRLADEDHSQDADRQEYQEPHHVPGNEDATRTDAQ